MYTQNIDQTVGYGWLPLTNSTPNISCTYTGSQLNSYNDGFDFSDLYAGLGSTEVNSFINVAETYPNAANLTSLRQYVGQCDKNYRSEDYNNFVKDERTGEVFDYNHKHTLFNLYQFNKLDSFKSIAAPPSLTLLHVDILNFLYDYDSIIYVETDSVMTTEDAAYIYGNT